MDIKFRKSLIALLTALLLTACSKAPGTGEANRTAEAPKVAPTVPPEAVAARTAFYEMYKPARNWAPDLMPLTITAGEVPGIKNENGKAGMWIAVFVSPSRRQACTLVYAVVDHGSDIHKGVTMGGTQVWSGPTPKSRPFQVTQFIADSDDAFKIASEKASAWVTKHPGKKVTISMANTDRFHTPVWYIMWGDEKSGYLAFVNATTGLPMK